LRVIAVDVNPFIGSVFKQIAKQGQIAVKQAVVICLYDAAPELEKYDQAAHPPILECFSFRQPQPVPRTNHP